MKRTITLTLILVCCVLAATYGQLCTLSGTISGFKQKSFTLVYGLGAKDLKQDTIYVHNDKFVWSGIISRPMYAVMFLDGGNVPLFLEPVKITLSGRADSLSQLKVSGSKTHNEMSAFFSLTRPVNEKLESINKKLSDGATQDKQGLRKQRRQLQENLYEMQIEHIATHPNSYFSLQLVISMAFDTYEKGSAGYKLLGESVLNNESAKGLIDKLAIMKRRALGETVPSFVQNDVDDKPVKFLDFKGKYVLIDFWASWCGPCRAENPNVLSAYNKFKDKGFTVIGVSLDNKKEDWVKAVKDDKMPWTQLSDLKGWKNELSSYYGIVGVPSNLLVGPNGKIIAKDLRGEDLHEELAKLF